MSNLFKSRSYVCDEKEKRVIDYNKVIHTKIEEVKKSLATVEGAIEGDGFVEGLGGLAVQKLISDEPEEDPAEKVEEILNAARAEADSIIKDASIKAETMLHEAIDMGRQQGYEDGRQQALIELNVKKQELLKEKSVYEEQYNKKMAEMEPVLVDTILEVVSKVTNIMAADKKDLILHLVNSAMSGSELSKEFLIRVSSEDYKYLIENKDKIIGSVSKEANIEIIEDPVMVQSQCIIEADSGIYDCSLSVQLDELISNIKLLACMI